MFTRGYERTRGTPSYREALLSAMRVYLAVPLFRPGDAEARRRPRSTAGR